MIFYKSIGFLYYWKGVFNVYYTSKHIMYFIDNSKLFFSKSSDFLAMSLRQWISKISTLGSIIKDSKLLYIRLRPHSREIQKFLILVIDEIKFWWKISSISNKTWVFLKKLIDYWMVSVMNATQMVSLLFIVFTNALTKHRHAWCSIVPVHISHNQSM